MTRHQQTGFFLVTKSFLHHEMERGCKLSGVKKIRIHDLRHSHVSHLIDLGFSAVAIADRVGHESIDITYRYSHLFPSKQVAMADRLDAVNASFEDCEEQDDDVGINADDYFKNIRSDNQYVINNLKIMKKNGIWYCIEFVANDKSIVVMADGYPYAKFAAIRLKN
ncbi:hypothetical protein DWV56_11450 [Holdemanella biformis]|uniref:Tyr recombinase domain-containing protein n=1 Tax=Holdemanella biformis TaxID=1735 RepID=A0A413CQX4_9FIRM|nr:hypothetical protein DWV56_11450 [Holdemanella biformis]